jgi:hypothetical protein
MGKLGSDFERTLLCAILAILQKKKHVKLWPVPQDLA